MKDSKFKTKELVLTYNNEIGIIIKVYKIHDVDDIDHYFYDACDYEYLVYLSSGKTEIIWEQDIGKIEDD